MKFLYFVIALAFVLRAAFVLYSSDSALHGDEVSYDILGFNLAEYHEFSLQKGVPSIRRSPGYPLFLAAAYSIVRHSFVAVGLLQAVLGSLTCLLIYLIGAKAADRKTGTAAALISAVYPFFIYYTPYILPETLLIFLCTLTVYQAMACSEKASFLNLALTGMFIAATGLVKPVFFAFLPFCLIGFFILWRGQRGRILKCAIMTFFFCAVVLPWGIRNHKQFGKFSIVYAGAGSYLLDKIEQVEGKWDGTTDVGQSLSVDRNHIREAVSKLKRRPVVLYKILKVNFSNFWSISPHLKKVDPNQNVKSRIVIISGFIFFDIILVLSLAGLWVSRRRWRNFIFLYGIIISTMVAYIPIHAITRYRRPVMPFVIIFAAVGLEHIHKKLKDKKLL